MVNLNTLGLILNLFGSAFLCFGLIINKKRAIEISVSRFSGNHDDNFKLPQVQDRLKQSKNAIIGFVLLFIGSILQIIANQININIKLF